MVLASFSRRTVSKGVLAGPCRTALTVCEHSETLRPNDDVVRLGIPMLSSKTKVVRDVPKSRVRTVFYNTKRVFCTQNALKSCIFSRYAESTGNFQANSLLSAFFRPRMAFVPRRNMNRGPSCFHLPFPLSPHDPHIL